MHRGFSHFGDSIYRNKPMWEIPIALKTQYPELSIFCDPSHICGRRDLLLQVAQKALDLGMDGLMLESHLEGGRQNWDPNKALTYGMSITDSCLAWSDTEELLYGMAESLSAKTV